MNEILHTKWGNAKIINGYYTITSRKYGCRNKRLHRLIYENVLGVKIPKDVVIHHKDGNKLNNCILNLEAMSKSKHDSIHMLHDNNPNYGKPLPKDTKEKIAKSQMGKKHSINSKIQNSKSRNTTGFFRVSKNKNLNYSQGFVYVYQYYDSNKKRKRISATTIDTLKRKVLDKGLEWRELT